MNPLNGPVTWISILCYLAMAMFGGLVGCVFFGFVLGFATAGESEFGFLRTLELSLRASFVYLFPIAFFMTLFTGIYNQIRPTNVLKTCVWSLLSLNGFAIGYVYYYGWLNDERVLYNMQGWLRTLGSATWLALGAGLLGPLNNRSRLGKKPKS